MVPPQSLKLNFFYRSHAEQCLIREPLGLFLQTGVDFLVMAIIWPGLCHLGVGSLVVWVVGPLSWCLIICWSGLYWVSGRQGLLPSVSTHSPSWLRSTQAVAPVLNVDSIFVIVR